MKPANKWNTPTGAKPSHAYRDLTVPAPPRICAEQTRVHLVDQVFLDCLSACQGDLGVGNPKVCRLGGATWEPNPASTRSTQAESVQAPDQFTSRRPSRMAPVVRARIA